MEARIARALNVLREDSDLFAADQDHLLELMDEFSSITTPLVILSNRTNAINHMYYSLFTLPGNNNNTTSQ